MAFSRVAPLLLAVMVAACSDAAPPRFVDGDAATPPPDSTGSSCTSTAQCDDGVACTRDICVVGGTCEHVPDGPMCVTTRRCMSAADCNDSVACTRDSCLVDGSCSHTAQNEMCPTGQTCDATRGCSAMTTPGTCRMAADCRDAYDCTIDTCGADGRCANTAQDSRCTTAGQVCRAGMGCINVRACSGDRDCDDMRRCNGAERCTEVGCVAGTAPDCADTDACTVDACSETGTMCTHAMNPTCMGMVRSGIYTIAMPASFMCAAGQVNVRLERFLFSVSGTNLSVTPNPNGPGMMGTISGSMFNVRADVGSGPFSCIESYALTGTFTDATHFTGTYTISFTPAVLCGFFPDCVMRSFPIQGTAM